MQSLATLLGTAVITILNAINSQPLNVFSMRHIKDQPTEVQTSISIRMGEKSEKITEYNALPVFI